MISKFERRGPFTDWRANEKDMLIEEQAGTIRLLTDLTEAGSWIINFAPDGSVASVKWGDGLRRLLGYHDQSDFPNDLGVFLSGIHPEDRDVFMGGITANNFDEPEVLYETLEKLIRYEPDTRKNV